MGSFGTLLWRIPEVIVGLIVVAIAVLINLEIVMRYFLNQPVGWSDELSRVLMVWLTFLGSAVAVGRGSHLGLNVLGRRLSPRQLKRLDLLVFAAIICFSVVLLWQGIEATRTAFRQTLTMTGLSVGWQYLAAPTGAALSILYALRNMREHRQPIATEPHGEDVTERGV